MPRFLVFAGDFCYPYGGWEDLKGGFESLSEARVFAPSQEWNWAQIVDLRRGIIVDCYLHGRRKAPEQQGKKC